MISLVIAIMPNTESKNNINSLQYTLSFNEPKLIETKIYNQDFTKISMVGLISNGLKIGHPILQVEPVRLLIP